MNPPVKLIVTRAPAATVLIRLPPGGVFFVEGLKKSLWAAQWGTGRFAKIGIPFPACTDYSMFMCLLFLRIVGAGW